MIAALNVYVGSDFVLVSLEPSKLRIWCLKIGYKFACKVYMTILYKSTFAFQTAVWTFGIVPNNLTHCLFVKHQLQMEFVSNTFNNNNNKNNNIIIISIL
jgi:hypothetical protein